MWISIWNSEISTATGIYCGSRKLRPDEWWGWWKPGANTLAYYKFYDNLNDSSGNNHPCTVAYWSAVYYTVSWDNKAITCSGNVMKSWIWQQDVLAANHTLSFWIKLSSSQVDNRVLWALGASGNISHVWISIGSAQWYCFYIWQPTWTYRKRTYTFSANTWYNIALSINSSLWVDCYVNWTQVWTTNTINSPDTTDLYFWSNYSLTDSSRMPWYLDDIIIEDKARTADEIAWYYNQTKSNYWL